MLRTRNGWSRILVMVIVLNAPSGLLCPPARADSPRTLIRNAALILTMDPDVGAGDLGVLEHADILLEGDRIQKIAHSTRFRGKAPAPCNWEGMSPSWVISHTNHLT